MVHDLAVMKLNDTELALFAACVLWNPNRVSLTSLDDICNKQTQIANALIVRSSYHFFVLIFFAKMLN